MAQTVMTIRKNAYQYDVHIEVPGGEQRYNFHDTPERQLSDVREILVNFWCKMNGHGVLYPEATKEIF